MKNKLIIILFFQFAISGVKIFSQTLSQTQMINARATGYAIVAARNPGKSFSILMIPWDGVNTLEYNANTQINPGWHPQAVVKGNYFYQNFDGADFSSYSSVITSQSEFDQYKNTGTQWWIVCSTLPSFSYSITSDANNSNVELGISNPIRLSSQWSSFPDGTINQAEISNDINVYKTLMIVGNQSAGLGRRVSVWDRLEVNGTFITTANAYFNSNVGIGTTTPGPYKLAVEGVLGARKIKVTQANPWADYVFNEDYPLKPLAQLEQYIKENKHLPEMPSAKEVEKNGVDVGDNQALLLKKIEELTLYMIDQNKKLDKLNKANEDLTEQNKILAKRIAALEHFKN